MVCGLVAAGALGAVVVGVCYSAIITYTSGGASLAFVTGTFLREQAESYGRTLFVISPYVAMAFSMAVVGRSTMTGVGSALGVALMEPLVSALMREGGGIWESVPKFLINANMQVILLENAVPDVLPRFGPSRGDLAGRDVNSPTEAAIILAVYAIVFIALAFYVYRRRDITAS